MDQMIGKQITLRAAILEDFEKIYQWLSKSDLTPSMMGPPDFPDHPIPSIQEFKQDYPRSFFTSSGDGKGRNYIILKDGEEVGTVGYDLLDPKKNSVVLDIWMRSEKDCGQGYGTDAINTLIQFIHEKYKISNFILCPSSNNKRAIKAYEKCGFKAKKVLNKKEQEKMFGESEYLENLLMVKELPLPGDISS